MEEDSLDLCKRAYELYGRGDFDAMLELFGEDVHVYVAPPNFESGTYRGRAAYRALIERWGASWASMRIEPRSMKAVGEWVLAVVDYRGRTHESDARDQAAVLGALALARRAGAGVRGLLRP